MFALISCKEDKICFTPPENLTFNFITTQSFDAFSSGTYNIDSFRIYYYENGSKTNIFYDTVSSIYQGQTYYVFSSQELGEKAWQENKTSTFLLKLNSARTDTLTIHCSQTTTGNCTLVSFDAKKYNNAEIDMARYGDSPLKYSYQIVLC
jgi:hypothetical protein